MNPDTIGQIVMVAIATAGLLLAWALFLLIMRKRQEDNRLAEIEYRVREISEQAITKHYSYMLGNASQRNFAKELIKKAEAEERFIKAQRKVNAGSHR